MKEKYVLALMEMAEAFAKTSTAERLKVGALLVKDDIRIIAQGVNGMPPKWHTEVCEDEVIDNNGKLSLVTKPECRHAEVATLEKLWNSSETSNHSSLFVTHSPCKQCAIKIVSSGISKVYYRNEYRIRDGLDYLENNKVEVIKV